MRRQRVKNYVLSITGFFIVVFSIPLILNTFPISPAYAACTANTRAEGLVTAKNLTGKFGTTATGGACVTDKISSFLSYDIRDYDFLKSKYYTLSKATKTSFATGFPTISDGVYLWTGGGDLTIPASISGTGTAVIFVDGKININNNINYGSGSGTAGLVLVAGSDINIASSVTTINAVLISSGTIYTGGAGCSVNSVGPVLALTVNGSIISLNKDAPPKFCRFLSNNSSAAEIINQQPKYLVLLRSLFADTLQIWKELSAAPTMQATGFDYTITNTSISPIVHGQSGSTNVTVALTASATNNQNVSFSASGLPDGATASFSPTYCFPTPTGCISTLTIATTAATAPGNYTVTVSGSPLSKTTTFTLTINSAAPTVSTSTATSLANTSVTLNGSVNPNGLSTTAYFRWGSSNPGCALLISKTADQSFTGTTNINYSQALTGLTASTPYYFCAMASNTDGVTSGSVQSFTTTNCSTKTIGTTITIGATACI